MILLLGVANAATWVVGTDAATLADTLALATSGDTIEIPDGTWAACVDTAGKSLTLRGTGTLDGTGCDNAVRVGSGEAVTFEDLTIVNPSGRALVVEWSTATLRGVTVRDTGRGDWSGGGVWAYGAALATESCTFADNSAYEGGAVYLYAYTTWTDVGSTFRGNAAAASGGAVMAYYDNTIVLDDTTFEDNSSGYYGGGVATWDYTDLTANGGAFRRNAAPGTGGGALFYYPVDSNAGVLAVNGAAFVDNSATDGGAVWLGWAQTATFAGATFEGNTASATGGAVLAYVTGTSTFIGNQFCDNTAVSGGAVSVQWTGADTWSNNVFLANNAAYGGAAHRYASYAGTISQNTFAGNVATAWGGAYYASWAYGDWRNNVVAYSEGAGIYAAESASLGGSTLAYDGYAANAVADGAGYFYVSDGRDGNVVADGAGFADYDASAGCASDLRLAAGSPFKDAGDPAVLDPDGSRSDMGAYGGPAAPVEDRDGDGADTTEDCDDTSADRHPGADERCDGVDDDCDGAADDAPVDGDTWYADADADGYGDDAAAVVACAPADGSAPDGTAANNRDCDDTDRWVNPDASDYPGDGVDADCNGTDNAQVVPDAPEADAGGGCSCAAVGGVAGGPPPAPWALVPFGVALLASRRRSTRR